MLPCLKVSEMDSVGYYDDLKKRRLIYSITTTMVMPRNARYSIVSRSCLARWSGAIVSGDLISGELLTGVTSKVFCRSLSYHQVFGNGVPYFGDIDGFPNISQ